MTMKRILIVLLLCGLVAGCAGSASRINDLKIGMTKADVVAVMGEPDFTSGSKDIEILSYKLKSGSLFTETYFVRIKGGRVDRFGQQGSFGSFY